MASTRDIKRRIKSISNTQQITKAMEMVAASKMRRAQDAAIGTRAYAQKALEILSSVSQRVDSRMHPLLQEKVGNKVCAVVISSDKGLCAGFNANVFKLTVEFIKQMGEREIDFIAVGKKGRDFLKRTGKNIIAEFTNLGDKFELNDVSPIAQIPIDEFIASTYANVFLIYTDFISTLKQQPVLKKLLPLKESELIKISELGKNVAEAEIKKESKRYDYLFEPTPRAVLENLLPRLTEMQIFQGLLESNASEHSARMVAMKNASDNAGEIISDLTLTYNQARQSSITTEISEISAGAAALQN